MFAIIETGSKQYKVAVGDKIKVEKLERKGDDVVFDNVLLVAENAENAKIGAPYVAGAKVHAKVLRDGKGEKLIVFKYHRKSRYRKKRGHRQPFTELEITKIS